MKNEKNIIQSYKENEPETTSNQTHECDAISLADAINTFKNMKNRKVSKIDIPMELWKYGGKVLHIRFVSFLSISGPKAKYQMNGNQH